MKFLQLTKSLAGKNLKLYNSILFVLDKSQHSLHYIIMV